MKCYAHAFRYEGDNNPHPSKAYTYESIADALSAYRDFVQESENFGTGTPSPMWLYFGEPDGDEEKYGYPDFPDRYIRVGPRGGVIVENGG